MIYDLAIIGSGFAGSLLAMIARRLGRSVILIERGTHPRVVIGESSTPLSNLLLEELADRYDLPAIRPLSKWGTWQQTHPELACGLKRGFTFYHHAPTDTFAASAAKVSRAESLPRERQLLVAASPHDGIADTHWYRADFDHFLVRQAQQAGAEYLDQTRLTRFTQERGHIFLEGSRNGNEIAIGARFVVDATGPRGFLHHALSLGERPLPGMPPTQALYTHFSGVEADVGAPSWCGAVPRQGGSVQNSERAGCPASAPPLGGCGNQSAPATQEQPPYPPEAAAVHHLFPGGWIWLLHFNNGITSAGVACTDVTAAQLRLTEGAPAWQRLLGSIPALRERFSQASAERPFTHIPRLSFRTAQITGPRWALLPSAAGFVDPLLSTGFPLTLLGIRRLAAILASTAPGNETSPEATARLGEFAAQTDAELLAAARLIAALYASFENFSVFTALTMLYFAAVSYAETAHRLGRPELARGFLLHDHAALGPALRALTAEAHTLHTPAESAAFAEKIGRAIEPINVAGLADPRRRNWYPVDAQDLFENAHKLHATREDIERLLARCGFINESVQLS